MDHLPNRDEELIDSGLNPQPLATANAPKKQELYESAIWGPTCDSGDKVFDHIMLPSSSEENFSIAAMLGLIPSVTAAPLLTASPGRSDSM